MRKRRELQTAEYWRRLSIGHSDRLIGNYAHFPGVGWRRIHSLSMYTWQYHLWTSAGARDRRK